MFFAVCALSFSAVGAEKPLIRTRLKVGVNQSNFVNVNRNDAEAAVKTFAETVGRRRGYVVAPEIEVYDSAAEFAKGIAERGVQLAVIDCWDYLSFDLLGVMEPMFVFEEPGGPLEPYVLLTPREKGGQSLAELRGQEIVILQNTNANLSWQWLETMLLEQNLGALPEFFRKAEIVNKPSAAVLPVFFGQRAACVVDQSAFQLMSELNPQVGKRLRAIATSKPYLDTILCLRKEGWQSEQEKKDLIASLEDLHKQPEGQQILTVFKVSKLEPFKEELLDTVRELKATHNRLTSLAKGSANASKPSSGHGKDLP
ncbi:MAG: PhnD/SsuA/transferrin family substrate-binding protein [Verrucomicrobia bacterium]|nr:PhnD/SsuA/transferrin family substrate-binding protein [Verrucomicrobiota bacterium]